MKRSAIALALLAALLLPCCLTAASTAAPQPAAAPGDAASKVVEAPALSTPTPLQPEWRGWPNCFASVRCPDWTLISCTGIPHGSKPICTATATSVTCNGETTYCNL